jgi:hypothetical protein
MLVNLIFILQVPQFKINKRMGKEAVEQRVDFKVTLVANKNQAHILRLP